jgi:LPXTG-site transpeptidase (sortase) family protein
VSIDAGALTTSLAGGFPSVCADPTNPKISAQPVGNPKAEEQGRRIKFTLGNVTNAGAVTQTIQIQYQVVVLNIKDNVAGVDGLNNKAIWAWSGGSLTGSADPVKIVEPDLSIGKSVDRNVVPFGSVVTYTLTVAHTAKSTALAYDVVVTDKLPAGLTYVPNSLKITKGPVGGVVNASAAPTLTVYWPVFDLTDKGEITFSAVYTGPDQAINTASVAYSSLMIDPRGPQSRYNTYSTERLYDPLVSTAVVSPPQSLPVTGFAPNTVTRLPKQPASLRYADMPGMWLEIPNLGLTLPLTGVPLTTSGWDLTWLSDQAGYLEGTTFPGQVGNTGITAHVTLADGTNGPFANLHKLYWGNQVILHADGYRYTYEVRSSRDVIPSDVTIFKSDGYTWLTLLTCKDYSASQKVYSYRLVVRAVLLKVEADTRVSGAPPKKAR